MRENERRITKRCSRKREGILRDRGKGVAKKEEGQVTVGLWNRIGFRADRKSQCDREPIRLLIPLSDNN